MIAALAARQTACAVRTLRLVLLIQQHQFAHLLARIHPSNGFSLHAGVVVAADERAKLERLCRYITRPALSTERLSLTTQVLIHSRLKTPTRDGTTQVVFEPLDFMAHCPARHPAGDLRSCKSADLPICHGQTGRTGAESAGHFYSPPWRQK